MGRGKMCLGASDHKTRTSGEKQDVKVWTRGGAEHAVYVPE